MRSPRPVNVRVGRRRLRERFDVLTKPIDQMVAPDPPRREIEDQKLLIIDGCVDLATIQDEERLHGGVPNALVAIDQRVVLDQREAQRRRFLIQRPVQGVLSAGLRKGCVKGW